MNLPAFAAGVLAATGLLAGSAGAAECSHIDALRVSGAQMQNRIAFAREQRIERHTAFRHHFLEGAPVKLVGDKYLTLIRRQLIERILQGLEQ